MGHGEDAGEVPCSGYPRKNAREAMPHARLFWERVSARKGHRRHEVR